MESASGIEMLAIPVAIGDDLRIDVERFGEVRANARSGELVA